MTQALTRYEAGVPQRTEFSDEQVSVIKNTIAKGATDAELGLFIATCRRTGLDPFMRQIWAIQRKSNEGTRENPKWVTTMQIQVGIDGYRVIRDRTGEFDGMEGPQWSEDGQTWLDYPYDPKPKFARVAVYRKGISRPFVAVARWEAYNQNNAMWSTMGAEQLAKCAEALSYRRAFPAEMSALPSGPVAELDAPSEEELADMPQVAALLEPAEGEYREVEPEPETAAADIPAPSDLLKAIAAKHGPQVVVQAKGIMPYLYGTGDFLKLNDEQRKDFAARLRVWLEDKDHAHVEQYTQEEPPRLVCERCGVDLEKLTPVQAPMV